MFLDHILHVAGNGRWVVELFTEIDGIRWLLIKHRIIFVLKLVVLRHEFLLFLVVSAWNAGQWYLRNLLCRWSHLLLLHMFDVTFHVLYHIIQGIPVDLVEVLRIERVVTVLIVKRAHDLFEPGFLDIGRIPHKIFLDHRIFIDNLP